MFPELAIGEVKTITHTYCSYCSKSCASFDIEYKTIDIGQMNDCIEVYKCSECGRILSDDEVEELHDYGPRDFDYDM